jgi:endonuclease/exonuclease/phosphatase family metal-dependent hydrolase
MPTVTVASFNAHHGLTRQNRRFDVVAVCEQLDADILAIQEVWRPHRCESVPMAVEVGDQLGYKVHEVVLGGVHRHPHPKVVRDPVDGVAEWGLAVLTRFASQPLDSVALPLVPGDGAARRLLPVELDVAGKTLTVVGAHLTHRMYGWPWHAARLRRTLAELDGPALVMGDMNMWGPVVERALPGWRRAVRGRTWPAHRPHSQLDHVLVSPGIEVLDFEVFGDVGSDHRPVSATIRF